MAAPRRRAAPSGPPPLRPAPPAVVGLGRALLADLPRLTDGLVAAILQEDPSYSGPDRLPPEDLRASCEGNLRAVLATLVGDADPADPRTLAPPRATGERRAEQGVPLESVLHAYRLGFRTIWEAMVARARGSADGVEALVDAATEVWEIVDVFSAAVADAYRATELVAARRDDHRRQALVDALLDGRGHERALAAEAAAGLELPEHGRYAVVVLEAGDPGADGPAAAQAALRTAALRSVWRSRAAEQVALVLLPDGHDSGVVVDALRLAGGLRAGVCPPVDGLAAVDVGHRAALTAARALPGGSRRVVALDDVLPGALLVTAPDLAARLVRRALGPVLELPPDERTLLLDTLRAWLATGGSAGRTATRLYCHRNTVLNRLRRLEALTGRSAERVDHLVEWSTALVALDVLPRGGTPDAPGALG